MLTTNHIPKLHVWYLAVAGLLVCAPLSAGFAQNLQPPPASNRLNLNLPIAKVAAIVVDGKKIEEAQLNEVELIRVADSGSILVKTNDELFAGDVIKTRSNSQVTLKFADTEEGTEQLVYLDQNTEVEIGSLCLRSGWLLAQVGWNFKICVGNTTLGVKKTEFEVASTLNEPLKVSVFKGKVELKRTEVNKLISQTKDNSLDLETSRTDLITAPLEVLEKEQVVITWSTSGAVVQGKGLSSDGGKQRIDFWSRRIIKASQPVGLDKANPNFTDASDRSREFMDARYKSLWEGDAIAYRKLGQVYNDWGMGGKARENLIKAIEKEPALATAPDVQANLGESYRLSGNYERAASLLKSALNTQPDYRFAYLSLGKTLVQSYEANPTNKTLLDDARQFYLRSLQDGSYGPSVNKPLVEQELDQVIEKRGRLFLIGQDEWISSEKFWRQKGNPEGVTYAGRFDLPELKTLGLNVSGPAELYIIGDQFKLTSGKQILTGTIVGTTTENYTAINLRFDDPRISSVSRQVIGLSLRETGQGGRLTFKSSLDKAGAVIVATRQ